MLSCFDIFVISLLLIADPPRDTLWVEDQMDEKEVTMNTNRSRLFPVLALTLLALCCLILPAHGDMGPKPSVTITLRNAPQAECYLDLLHLCQGTPTSAGNGFSPEEYDSAILTQLRTQEEDGWVLAFSTGTSGVPVFGDLRPDQSGAYRFTYSGLPQTFRIAAATAHQAQSTQASYTRTRFHTNLVYDWQTNTLTDATPAPLFYLAQLLSTLVPTLAVEAVLLLLFRFRTRRSWLVFLGMNLVTQVGLHLFCAGLMPAASTHWLYYALTLLLPELVILLVELLAFVQLSREHSPSRRMACIACANAASFLLTFFPLHWLSPWLTTL